MQSVSRQLGGYPPNRRSHLTHFRVKYDTGIASGRDRPEMNVRIGPLGVWMSVNSSLMNTYLFLSTPLSLDLLIRLELR